MFQIKSSINKITCFIAMTMLFATAATAQVNNVGIGTTTPDPSAILELQATDQGFLPPRMDQSGENSITNAVQGLTIFNTEINNIAGHSGYRVFDNGGWNTFLNQKPNGEIALGNITSNYFNIPTNAQYEFQINGNSRLRVTENQITLFDNQNFLFNKPVNAFANMIYLSNPLASTRFYADVFPTGMNLRVQSGGSSDKKDFDFNTGTLTVKGDTAVIVNGNQYTTGNQSVTGNQTINGNQNVNGDITVNNNNLIEFRRYNLDNGVGNVGNTGIFNTGISANDWNASIAGFSTGPGDINEFATPDYDIMTLYVFKSGGTWWLRYGFKSHTNNEPWPIVDIMFIRTEISESFGF